MVNHWSVEVDSERCGQLVDAGSFFTPSLTWTLTHLTADISFFSPLPPGESDYEKWKSVFNVIQGLEEVKYFVCVRQKGAVLGRFSSLKPLSKALSAVIRAKAPNRLEKMDLKWLDELLGTSIASDYPQLLSRSSSVTSSSDVGLNGTSWCNQLWKKLCCFK
nr:uncharacterized protein LOC106678022 [Halyomorpha halys]XP_024217270.1 uncharacterized protein LOC106678022 [Halyomorpha halys]